MIGLLCLFLLLTGCGQSREQQRREELAAALQGRDAAFTAAVRAEYADKTVQFRLRCEEDGEGWTLRVLEPEEIAGISLRFDGAEAQLRFEQIQLDAGPLDRYGLSPASALPALMNALREGHLESAWAEEGLAVWELAADDALTVRVWLDDELVPRRAALISEGRVSVYVEISDWALGG